MRRSQVCYPNAVETCISDDAIAKWYQGIKNKFTVRGVVRGGSLALCAVNVVGCGLAYTFGKREKEDKKV